MNFLRFKIGAGCDKLQELSGPVVSQAYKFIWERDYLDSAELARLRWIEGWKIAELANHYGLGQTTIRDRLRVIKNDRRHAVLRLKLLKQK